VVGRACEKHRSIDPSKSFPMSPDDRAPLSPIQTLVSDSDSQAQARQDFADATEAQPLDVIARYSPRIEVYVTPHFEKVPKYRMSLGPNDGGSHLSYSK